MYGGLLGEKDDLDKKTESDEVDIEAEISREVEGMKSLKSARVFQPVKVDVQCGMLFFHSTPSLDINNNLVMFFKTREPVQPVPLVHRICSDAFESPNTKRSRWVKRLTPMMMMGKATEKGLQEVCMKVLGPSFHVEGAQSRKVCALPLFKPIQHSEESIWFMIAFREATYSLKCRSRNIGLIDSASSYAIHLFADPRTH